MPEVTYAWDVFRDVLGVMSHELGVEPATSRNLVGLLRIECRAFALSADVPAHRSGN